MIRFHQLGQLDRFNRFIGVFLQGPHKKNLGLSCFLFPLQVLYRKWPFGRETEWLCRIANSAQDTPMFMSSFAITAIAADRFRQGDMIIVGEWYSSTLCKLKPRTSDCTSLPS